MAYTPAPSVAAVGAAYPVSSLTFGFLEPFPTWPVHLSFPVLASKQYTSCFSVLAPVTNRLSPQITGELCPDKGTFTFHNIFVPELPLQLTGTFRLETTPALTLKTG